MPHSRTNRSRAHIWALLGALIAFALSVAVPAIVITNMKLLPQESEKSITTAPAEATVYDPTANCDSSAPRSCFIVDTTTQLKHQQTISPAESDENINLDVSEQIVRTDTDHPIISISDRLSLIRDSTYPVLDPTSTLTVTAEDFGMELSTGGFTRDGLQYFFPFETEKRSYDYFDPIAERTIPLDFVEERDQRYVFTHSITPENLIDAATRSYTHPDGISDEPTGEPLQSELTESQRETLRKLLVDGPASRFYPDGMSITGAHVSGTVVLKPYYTATRTVSVDPNSGVIVDQEEEIFLYLAQDDEEAQATATAFHDDRSIIKQDNDVRSRTLFHSALEWDEQTQAHAREAAEPTNEALAMLRILAFICQVVGVGLLVFGLWRYNAIRKV